jgi:hypothetical protein
MLQPEPASGFRVLPLFTTGGAFDGYRPPGVLDGLAAFAEGDGRVTVLATHELEGGKGYPYALPDGRQLKGARITRFTLDAGARRIVAAGLAFRDLRDRAGAAQRVPLEVLCSAAGYEPGSFGFVDRVFFVNEEVSKAEGHPHGGSVYALDVRGETLWAAPELGRGSWENVAAVTTPDGAEPDGHVALLLGDDLEYGRAPLYLWIGRKRPGGSFLERNGLARGQLHVWVADNGDRTPQDWTGSGTRRAGRFVPLAARLADPGPGTDALGYRDDTALRIEAERLGAFMFSRPEDLHADPRDGTRVAFASTGHGQKFPADDWGGIYLLELQFSPDGDAFVARAELTLLYDSDDTGDIGIRNPDNLVWAGDGALYVQEDKAVKRARFGAASGREASVWRLDPRRPETPQRLATIDRRAVPSGATDAKAGELGAWESSGIIDVTALLPGPTAEIRLLLDVQAHGVTDGPVGGARDLVQASQLLLLEGPALTPVP